MCWEVWPTCISHRTLHNPGIKISEVLWNSMSSETKSNEQLGILFRKDFRTHPGFAGLSESDGCGIHHRHPQPQGSSRGKSENTKK